MDQWTKSLREDKFRHRSKNPSFSSSLLDAIYRSIDDGEDELVLYKETMKKKQQTSTRGGNLNPKIDEETDDFRRACLIEKWMEKKVSEKVVVRRKSVPDFKTIPSSTFHSASSSSDSSSGGFSSSEDGSRSKPIRPIRTSLGSKPERFEHRRSSNIYEAHYHQHQQEMSNSNSRTQKQKEGNFNKTKSKAMKIYGDLKKVKQPISPGGKLASFLNSLFTAGNTKKGKFSSSVNGVEDLRGSDTQSKSTQTSTCSSASSFSRSCLSKTPSSRGTGGTKRSVRFYPVSEIVDEDSRPCGYKSLYEQHHQPKEVMLMNQELKLRLMEKNKKIEAAAKEFLRNYQEKNLDKKTDSVMQDPDYDEDDEDDDAASYASSDLFELDNFAAIGIERYREELPVYETTNLDKNRAIANAFLL